MAQEESIQKPQTSITLSELPAGAKVLIPIIGIPVALHALTGAAVGALTFAVGALTFAVGALFVGHNKGKMPKSPEQSSPKSTVESETTA
ncbi:MAG: hypothetical protein JZU70_08900 [Chlorobium sp.]|jgi:hypothetical protein|nr:hypothetical protein [Chlorobium sp.]MBV5304300.1 hypothetical protein [Chlorobium sp.]